MNLNTWLIVIGFAVTTAIGSVCWWLLLLRLQEFTRRVLQTNLDDTRRQEDALALAAQNLSNERAAIAQAVQAALELAARTLSTEREKIASEVAATLDRDRETRQQTSNDLTHAVAELRDLARVASRDLTAATATMNTRLSAAHEDRERERLALVKIHAQLDALKPVK